MTLRFLIMTAARSGEVRRAEWSEIDFDQSVWTVPAVRMKAKRQHRVPLSTAALQMLQEARRHRLPWSSATTRAAFYRI
ncbi:tyrosine-type recombinase/integrase [Stenotrophomonas tumulicola]|uniref:Tyrosine-type recombinase/integrase n=1 Tax=Stenotrophomonas tumulicola TaxID=1685415 RepID=A0A7W3FQE4_9GAMM|nr:tyrosine-type recombinase/integrase [Stenotrophomonas tumulicola]